MNFRNFKKVHEDDDKAILKNEMGHSIIIAKKSLSKQHAKGLNDLPLYQAEGSEISAPDDSVDGAPETGNNDTKWSDDQRAREIQSVSDERKAAISGGVTAQTSIAGLQPQPQNDQLPDRQHDQLKQPQMPAPQGQTMVQDAQQQTQGYAPLDTTAQQAAHYEQQAVKYAQDIASGHVTPETYHSLFAKKDTLGKIGTLFGLLVGGAGAGITGGSNPVLKMMDQQITNDLDAQKTSKANAQNFLRINQQNELQRAQIPDLLASGKLKGAEAAKVLAATKLDSDTHAMNQMKISALNYAMRLADKYPPGSPQAAAAGQVVQGLSHGVQQSIQQTSQTAAQQKAAQEQQFGARQQFNIMAGMPEVAADNYARHVPGFEGQASIPVSQGDREKIGTGLQFQQQLQRFMNWTKDHSGSLSPSQINEGTAMAADLQGAYRQATHGGVYKEGEQNFISKLIDQDPTKFFNSIRVMPQLNALSRENTARIDQTAKTLGLPGYKNPNEEAKANPREGTTGTHAGKPVIFQNGKWSYR